MPAELDLGRQQEIRAAFDDAVATIRALLAGQTGSASGVASGRAGDASLSRLVAGVDDGVTAATAAAADLFKLSANFAQDQAVSVLNGPFAAAETRMAEAVGRLAAYRTDAAARDMARLNAARRAMAWLIGIAGGVSVAVVATVGTLLARGISGRVRRLTRVMRALAGGDLDVAIPCVGERDEIGQMAGAVAVFKQNALETARLTAEQQTARAARERRQALMERLTQEFGVSISGVMKGLASSTDVMVGAAGTMAESARGAHEQATVTAGRAAESSRDLLSIAAAAEQMTASVDEITRQVAAAARVARTASERAAANRQMMGGLAEAASCIGDATRLIEAIAGKTNLLALNATIEAARAGEAGRGFAVVAGEVKALSRQTAEATAVISTQVSAVRGAAEAAVAAMHDIGTTIGEIDAVTTAISAASEQQSTTTREIAANVQAVARATDQTARAMSDVAAAADKAGLVSTTVLDGVAAIGREAQTMRGEIDHFLGAVREDSADRRGYERIAGQGATVTVRVPGEPERQAPLVDISLGGAAVRGAWRLTPGAEVDLALPEGRGIAAGRVVRCTGGVLAIVFRQDADTSQRVRRCIASLSPQAAAV